MAATKGQIREACRRLGGKTFARTSSMPKSPFRQIDTIFRLAIVGSGPAGFYSAYRVLSRLPHAQIDMYEALPVPYGLVRHGVAPDHPEVKNCQAKFEEVASSPRFKFVGNISVGSPGHLAEHITVPLQSLMSHYHSVLLAYGATEDRQLEIPGETSLNGIYSARQFVGWYNGLPDCTNLQPDLARGSEAVIIGQGNVALDVARILLTHIDVLKKTDVAEDALAQLAKSQVKRVHVVGRRGPIQAAFTIKEVRELMRLPAVGFHPIDGSLMPSDYSILSRPTKRLLDVIQKGSQFPASLSSKSWSLDSCLSPKRFLSSNKDQSAVGGTLFDVTQLTNPLDPKSIVMPTGEIEIIASDVVFRSIGYKSRPLSGFKEAGIRFDERRGVVIHDGFGRLTAKKGRAVSSAEVQPIPGMYCAGWVKRGPTGVIATTMQDAFITGDTIVQDWLSGTAFLSQPGGQEVRGWDGMKLEFGSKLSKVVSWAQWRLIDEAERERGFARGKTREKFTDIRAMLSVIG